MPRAGLRPVPLHQFHSPETGLDLVDLGFGGIWDLVGFGIWWDLGTILNS